MKVLSLRAFVAVLALPVLLAGCGRDEPPATEPAITAIPDAPAPSAPAVAGQGLYALHCMQCHEGQVTRAPHRTIIGLMAPHRVVAALESGAMQEQGAKLSPQERRAVAEYVTGRPFAEPVALAAELRCAAGSSNFDFAAPPDVLGWGVDHGNSHFYRQQVAGFSRAEVPKLTLKWSFAFPDAIRARSQPVTGGGALFMGSHDGTVYALDARSGCVRWTFKAAAEVRTGILLDGWTAGDTGARPGLYFGDLTGNVYALDAQSGELRWRDRPDDHHSLTITASPVRFEDRLYVALSSLEVTAAADPGYACCTFRGGVVAYDAATGKRLWTAHTIAETPAQVDVNTHGTAAHRALRGAGVGHTGARCQAPAALCRHRRELLLARERPQRCDHRVRYRQRLHGMGVAGNGGRRLEHGLRGGRSHQLSARGRPRLRFRRGADAGAHLGRQGHPRGRAEIRRGARARSRHGRGAVAAQAGARGHPGRRALWHERRGRHDLRADLGLFRRAALARGGEARPVRARRRQRRTALEPALARCVRGARVLQPGHIGRDRLDPRRGVRRRDGRVAAGARRRERRGDLVLRHGARVPGARRGAGEGWLAGGGAARCSRTA